MEHRLNTDEDETNASCEGGERGDQTVWRTQQRNGKVSTSCAVFHPWLKKASGLSKRLQIRFCRRQIVLGVQLQPVDRIELDQLLPLRHLVVC